MATTLGRTGIALLAVVAASVLYVLAAVPLLEPPVRRRSAESPAVGATDEPSGSFAIHHGNLTFLADLFPADAWELADPKVVKTDRAVFLFQQWEPQPERRLEVRPCTVVFLPQATDQGTPAAASCVVLSAPSGAILQFDEDSDPTRAQFGTLLSGRLPGEIRISRAATSPAAHDGLEIVTSNIQIDQQQIWTPQDVRFRYGATHGSGRDLSITLQPKAGPDPNNLVGSVVGGVKFVELVHVEKVHLEMPSAPRPDRADGADASGEASTRGLDKVFRSAGDAPVEVTCQGPFRIDLVEQLASFEERVEIVRSGQTGLQDRLECDVLRVHFRRRLRPPAATPETQADPGAAREGGAGWFEVDRLVAVGSPVSLAVPSALATARGRRLEYNTRTRLLHLEDSQSATLEFAQQRIEAPNIQYEMAEEEGRLGRAWASGPGRLHRAAARAGEAGLEASWGKELLIRPQRDRHVLSLTGGTSIRWEGMGTFSAEEMHAWLVESKTPGGEAMLAMDRLMAQGQVAFDSPRMLGRTQRLEAWFHREPADLNLPATTSAAPPSPEAGARLASLGRDSAGEELPSSNRLEVRGDLVRVQVTQAGAKTRLDEISVQGQVEVTESAASSDAGPPLQITGDDLVIEDAESNRSTIRVSGRPAKIAARGMTLVSDAVQMSQAQNRVWIEDGGQMTLPAYDPRPKPRGEVLFENARSGSGRPAAGSPPAERFDPAVLQKTTSATTPMIVTWKGRLDFDGEQARFDRDVQVRAAHRLGSGEIFELLVMGGLLDVRLTQRIEFSQPKPAEDVQLESLTFDGHVYLEGRTTLANAITSQERMQIRNLTLDHASGRMHGEGPGWLSSTRLDSGPSPSGGTTAAASSAPRLLFVHVEFAREMNGNLRTRSVDFTDQVRGVFGPVARWDDELDPSRPDALGETSATLTCQRMTLGQVPSALPGGGDAVEFEATGNAIVEGQKFLARAARVSYSQAKDLLILAGDGVADAEFWKKPRRNSPKADAIARTILYWRRDGRVEIDGAKYFDLNPLADELQQRRGR